MPYKVDMGSDGNIMPFNIFTKLFPSTINGSTGGNKRCNQAKNL